MSILLESLLPPWSNLEIESGFAPSRTLMAIPEGRAGIALTLDLMVALTKQYRHDATLHAIASDLVAPLPGKSYFAEAQAIQDYVRNTIRYTQDIYDVETLQSPLVTLERMQGDCDDQALLVGTLLQAVGHPVRYVAYAFTGPGEFEHVMAQTRIGRDSRWYGVETTEPVGFGWMPESNYPPLIRTV